jgi:hypothetical protein
MFRQMIVPQVTSCKRWDSFYDGNNKIYAYSKTPDDSYQQPIAKLFN